MTPNDLMAEYYEQRANAGLVISEATAISEEGGGWRNAPHMRTAEHVAAWAKIVDKVHAKGAKMYLQLWHQGRQAHSSHHPTTNRTVSASAIAMTGMAKTIQMEETEPEVPHALTIEEIKVTIEDFVASARLAKEAGFDGVEIHSANGYLVDQFLQSCSNTRTDEYGGSAENRTRLLVEIVDAITKNEVFPANRIGFRVSPNGAYGGMGSEDNIETFTHVAKTMNKLGLAYIHVMDGVGFGYHGKTPVMNISHFRKHFDGVIMCNVGLNKGIAEGMLRSGAADLACFGRLYISNPDLPERFANDWPVEPEAAYEHWWAPTGAKGYTDWPTYKPTEEEKE
jgi:N-ethylmaleimide reductase